MHGKVRIFVAACFYYSGLVKLARWWTRRSRKRLIILNYHRASRGNLRSHLLYLRRHYRMLHLEEALEELWADEAKQASDSRTPLVLTFDDGYCDNYTHAFALARELQIPLTIFLVPGYVESSDHFWWLEAERLTHHTQVDKVTIEGRTYHLQHLEDRKLLAGAIDDHLRRATSLAEREAFLTTIREVLAVPPSCATDEEGVALSLKWTQIREMEESGWVSFGAHTMHHPILAHLTDPAEVQHEVGECRNVLEQQLGHPIRAFAYPFGQPDEVGYEAPRAVQDAGYDWVLTTVHGINTPESHPHQLRRVFGDVSRHWLVMAAETSGVWKFFSLRWKRHLDYR